MANKGNLFTILIAAAGLFAGADAYAQNALVAPPPAQQQSTTNEQQPQQQQPSQPQQPQATLSTKISCIDAYGNPSSFSLKQWQEMPLHERQKYGKAGITVQYGNERFTLGLRDLTSVSLGYVGGQVPTASQWNIINNNLQAINSALESVGGDPIYPSENYWKKGDKDNGLKSARICAPKSFAEVVMTPSAGQAYEQTGPTVDGVTVGICNERYGYIDLNGNCIVPAKYEYLSVYGAACDNGLYGMIDHHGNVIAPFIYDGLIAGEGLTIVFQEGECGAFDRKGYLVIPIEYSDIVPSPAKPLAMACKDGKYALLDASGRRITDHIYDRVVSSQDCGFAVGRDGRSVYLGIDGKEYGNADDMTAAVLSKSTLPRDQYVLAKMLYSRKDYFEAMKYCQPAADAGYAPAQCLMGHFYANGRGSASKSDKKAFEWYEKAAKQDDEEACYYLSKMYEKGAGVYRNPQLAAEWLERSHGYRPSSK